MTCRRIELAVAETGQPWRWVNLLDATSAVVGRDAACDVVLDSPQVSRRHLELSLVPEGVRVTDRSSNGTQVGRELVHRSERTVSDEAELGLGPYRLRIRIRSMSSESGVSLELRRKVHQQLLDHLDLASLDRLEMSDEQMRPKVMCALDRVIATLGNQLSSKERRALALEMVDEVLGLGPLQPLLDDDEVSEIMVVDPDTIYVERAGTINQTDLRFTDSESCRAIIERIVAPLGRRVDESAPLVDARLPDGSRVNAIIPPLAVRGPCITIRKFPQQALSMSDLVDMGSLTERMARFLERCVRVRKNILISGGTGSGKTTLLNVLSRAIPTNERIVTIEDAAELRLQQPHVVSLEAKPPNLEGAGSYTIRDLVKNALRMRPDRIVVGECRADEAIDMLQAMNTGHAGSMTTTHANSGPEALTRIQTLCLMAGLDLSRGVIREHVSASLDIVIQQARFSDGSRRITTVSEVGSVDGREEIPLHNIYEFRRSGSDRASRAEGYHCQTGYLPTFLGEFQLSGLVDRQGYV